MKVQNHNFTLLILFTFGAADFDFQRQQLPPQLGHFCNRRVPLLRRFLSLPGGEHATQHLKTHQTWQNTRMQFCRGIHGPCSFDEYCPDTTGHGATPRNVVFHLCIACYIWPHDVTT